MLAKGFSVPELAHPALPPAVSWLPLPLGWWWLSGVLLLLILAYGLLRLARWRRNRWRREAEKALATMQNADDWLTLIKRVQLVHQPREQISASATPHRILNGVPLDEVLHQTLCKRYCQPDNQLTAETNQQLSRQLSRWLEALPDV